MDNLTKICILTASHLSIFLIGVFSRAASSYLGQKFIDQRKDKENKAKLEENFNTIFKLFPELIREMENDILNDTTCSVRTFGIFPKSSIPYNGDFIFAYYEDEHIKLNHKIALMEEYGFIVNIDNIDFPKFKLLESFIKLLKKSN